MVCVYEGCYTDWLYFNGNYHFILTQEYHISSCN
uniref:Uncharacterized protein n=1 Tax=Anguilla anguilla TaxID=7936 RepID=A0A0E9QUR5_ANGAN